MPIHVPGIVKINDKASSGYIDIGSMRIHWGRTISTSDGSESFSFSVAFAAVPQVMAITEITTGTPAAWGGVISSVTINGFDYNRDNTIANATHNPYINWLAIGLKP